MSLAPLLDAAPAMPVHAFAAMTAFMLGIVQLAAPKGTLPHRTLGWIWVCLMLAVAISSFWIHAIRLVGPWSPIHLLSIFVLITVPLAVWKAHRHQVADHRRDRDVHQRCVDDQHEHRHRQQDRQPPLGRPIR